MKPISLIFALLAAQYTNAAVYNCNGTFTDKPCGNTPEMRITTSSGILPTATVPSPEAAKATKNDAELGSGSLGTTEPKFCTKLRANLKDARWRKANMAHRDNIAKAAADEKTLVDEIWSKCSHRFE